MILRKGSKETTLIVAMQARLNRAGYPVAVDGIFGEETLKTVLKFQEDHGLIADGQYGPKTQAALESKFDDTAPMPVGPAGIPVWLKEAKKYSGKHETDSAFNKFMSAKWPLLGLSLGTISQNWAAWCGLAIAVSLAGVGYKYQKDGAAARNWAKYGVAIDWRKDGIPRGAIVHINHALNCASAASNHVAMADGDCTAADLLKVGARINLYGGNQGNMWKVSSFPAREICNVRWPLEAEKPPRVVKSVNCSGSKSGGSTR